MQTHTANLAVLSHTDSELAPPIAHALAEQGIQLALTGGGDHAALTEKLSAFTQPILTYPCALTESSIQAAADQITAKQGIPNILITCAPAPITKPAIAFSEADFRDQLDKHLVHAFLWSKVLGQQMVQNGGGVIVHITALSGMGGWAGWLGQSAALGGVHNLVQTLAAEWAQAGVRVNALVPGITAQTAAQIRAATPHKQEVILQRIPMQRLAKAEEICQALLYLISPNATYISGEILRVDGGWDIWGRLYAQAKREES